MKYRPVNELIDYQYSAWPMLQEWVNESPHYAELLPVEQCAAEKTLYHLQVTTRSPMGALAYHTGGLLIDHGWLRFLGSGHARMPGNLLSWNGKDDEMLFDDIPDALIVAVDAIGGCFAINAGMFPDDLRIIWYFAPDTLTWNSLSIGYTDFMHWALFEGIAMFYEDSRWPGWECDVSIITGDQGFSIYPPLWAEGGPINQRDRRVISLQQLVEANMAIAVQLAK